MLTVAKLVKKLPSFFNSRIFHLFLLSVQLEEDDYTQATERSPKFGVESARASLTIYLIVFPISPFWTTSTATLLRNQNISTCIMGTARKLEGIMTTLKYDARGIVTVRATCGQRLHTVFFPWFKYSE
jgi:hypothetical protein